MAVSFSLAGRRATNGSIVADLGRFLASFPEASDEWPRILDSLKAIFGVGLRPATLRAAIQTYFRLPAA